MPAAARRCRCARSPARRSSWSASARSRTRWRISIPSASPAASSARATSSGLVERAAETIDREEAEKLAAKMMRGKFDLEDYASQLRQIGKMGSLSGILGMLPGVGKIKAQLEDANLDTAILKRQAAIISSMTPKERRVPDIIKASRKKRIAAGSGTSVQEVNRLLKQFDDMTTMMKRMNKLGQKGLMRHGLSALMPKGMVPNRRPF